ncbi:MAG TPA: CIA30 family protein [Xanthomonadales bacterium]|nr:CIA30 family protein [Xanthomonadales bacterium]
MQLELDAERWHVINDRVMGGRSRSEVRKLQPSLIFSGELSLENNGGFASARCRFQDDFDGITGFRLDVRGDGRDYQFRLRESEASGAVAWRADFPSDGSRQVIDLPLEAFRPVIRGRRVSSAGELRPSSIRLLGFMLADRQSGPFTLEVHSIEPLRQNDGPA